MPRVLQLYSTFLESSANEAPDCNLHQEDSTSGNSPNKIILCSERGQQKILDGAKPKP
jgi:hypothetical protein